MVSGYIASTSTVTFDRGGADGTTGDAIINYSVIECFQDEISVQRGSATLASGATTQTATLSSAVTTGQSVVFTYADVDASVNANTRALVRGSLTDSTTVSIARNNGSSYAADVRWEVVEFDAGVTIQTEEYNLTTAADFQDRTITSSTPEQTWVFCQYGANNEGMRGTTIGCEQIDSTTVRLHHWDNQFAGAKTIRYYTIEFPSDVAIQSGFATESPTGTDGVQVDFTYTLTSDLSSLTSAFPYITSTTLATGGPYPRQRWIASFPSISEIQLSFFRPTTAAADDVDFYWQTIDFGAGGGGSVPDAPTIDSAEDEDRNPDLATSAYSGTGSHTETDWKVVTTADCEAGTEVWNSEDDTTNLETITVDSSPGTFIGALTGEIELAEDTVYYACARHTNGDGDSDWSAAVEFTTNIFPVASLVSIDGGAATIIPSPGTTTAVASTATITDSDSCEDLVSVNATFYRTSLGAESASNDRHRYTVPCGQDGGSCTGPSDTDATYTCNFAIQYFAEPTDASSPYPGDSWTMEIAPEDETAKGVISSSTTEMATVVSTTSTASIDYGTIALGADTGASNQVVTVENIGNVGIDLQASGYASTPGDGGGMACTSGSIPIENIEYATSAFVYGAGIDLATSLTDLDFDLQPSAGLAATDTLYYGLSVPAGGVGGSCSGVAQITAIGDPFVD
jgi:hypothetical protein